MPTVTAGDGVTGTFGTVKRDDGTTQVTYAGAPIYYFAKDTKAGDVTGQGVGGVWFVAAVAGGPGGATASGAPASGGASAAAGGGTPAKIIDFGFDPANRHCQGRWQRHVDEYGRDRAHRDRR